MTTEGEKKEMEKTAEGGGDDESTASTVELDPEMQVLMGELKVSVEEAQQLLKDFGSVAGVYRKRFLDELEEEDEREKVKTEVREGKSILRGKKVIIKDEPSFHDAVSNFEDAVDGMDVEFDEVDAPSGDAGAASSSSSSSSTPSSSSSPTINIPHWKEGVPLRRWCFLARMQMKSYASASQADKKLSVLSRLDVNEKAFVKFLDYADKTSLTTEQILETMANDQNNDFGWRRKRRPNWPRYSEKDSISAFNLAMKMEAEDSGAADSEVKAAYLSSLCGTARNIASMRTKTEPNCTSDELMKYVKDTLERTDTQADVNLLDSFKQEPGQSVSDFAAAMLEKTTSVLLPRDYTETQIKGQAKGYFERNLRPEIGK